MCTLSLFVCSLGLLIGPELILSVSKDKVEEALRVLSSLVSGSSHFADINQPTAGSSNIIERAQEISPSSSSACRIALSNLREIRSRFAPYNDTKGKRPMRSRKTTDTSSMDPGWSHKFFCLAHKDAEKVPNASEKAILSQARLGEKVLCFPSYDLAYKEIMVVLVREYPKLADCGGGGGVSKMPPKF